MADLTRFTERNPLILAEARKLVYQPLKKISGKNDSGSTEFYSLGSFYSTILETPLFGGLKTRPKAGLKERDSWLNEYSISSLANLILLDELCPELTELMPKFFGVVVQDDRFKGILIEDYTKNNQSRVTDLRSFKEDFPKGFLDKLKIDIKDKYELDDLGHVFGVTYEGLRIMDVNEIPWLPQYEKRREEIILELYSNHMNPHRLDI